MFILSLFLLLSFAPIRIILVTPPTNLSSSTTAIVPPVNYSRPPNNPELYADAYPDAARIPPSMMCPPGTSSGTPLVAPPYDHLQTRQQPKSNHKVWQPNSTTTTTSTESQPSTSSIHRIFYAKIDNNHTEYLSNFTFIGHQFCVRIWCNQWTVNTVIGFFKNSIVWYFQQHVLHTNIFLYITKLILKSLTKTQFSLWTELCQSAKR